MTIHSKGWLLALFICASLAAGCERSGPQTPPAGDSGGSALPRPNILFVVWDTVGAEHLSLYGYQRPTTPLLDRWAQEARVYDNCVAVGSTTVPSHVAMFSGLLPAEHGTTNERAHLTNHVTTLAELLGDAGYRTYLFSANPYISQDTNIAQGFDTVEHPWSPHYADLAEEIVRRKLAQRDHSSELGRKFQRGKLDRWAIKACGELAQRGVESWLATDNSDRPFFVFLNYMEAHWPLIPPYRFRKRLMTPEQVQGSYAVDRSEIAMWRYVFRLRTYTDEELELTRLTYDSVLLELDALFAVLLQSLRDSGHLENTVVVLAGDHGEHLGDHHLLDHQFSVYEPLMRVPLVLSYPPRVAPGREKRPVMNVDLFPTLLELAGLTPPVQSKATSLLRPPERRVRLGEYPDAMKGVPEQMHQVHPEFDPTRWTRTLRAYYDDPFKLIFASNGQHELYDLEHDPGELNNLIDQQPQKAEQLVADLRRYLGTLRPVARDAASAQPPVDSEHQRRLRSLGYLGGGNEEDDERQEGASSQPATTAPTTDLAELP